MKVRELNQWDVSPQQAVRIQRELAAIRQFGPPLELDRITYIAGADVSMNKHSDEVYASVVILSFPDLEVVETRDNIARVDFPYIPGFLSFREIPVLIKPFESLKHTPDVVIGDGQGIAHPRGMGFSTHLGLTLDIPTIGCAKTRLTGMYDEPGSKKGDTSPLYDKEGLVIGSVVRTKDKVAPVYVSIGNKIDLESAVRIVLACVKRYRLPEPSRQAHMAANNLRTTRTSKTVRTAR